MDWYSSIFNLIDLRSFSNLWYWIALVAVWSITSRRVLGVPYDLVAHAGKTGGLTEADLETMVRINVARQTGIVDAAGVWIAGLVCFVLTSLAVLGFYHRVEFAQALFLILAPVALVGTLSLRAARRVQAGQVEEGGAGLSDMLRQHHATVQAIGLISVFVTLVWGMYRNLQIAVLGY